MRNRSNCSKSKVCILSIGVCSFSLPCLWTFLPGGPPQRVVSALLLMQVLTLTFCFSPTGPADRNSRAGGDGRQVLPRPAHSATQILALQQEANNSGCSPAGSGGGDQRLPDTKVRVILLRRSQVKYRVAWICLGSVFTAPAQLQAESQC